MCARTACTVSLCSLHVVQHTIHKTFISSYKAWEGTRNAHSNSHFCFKPAVCPQRRPYEHPRIMGPLDGRCHCYPLQRAGPLRRRHRPRQPLLAVDRPHEGASRGAEHPAVGARGQHGSQTHAQVCSCWSVAYHEHVLIHGMCHNAASPIGHHELVAVCDTCMHCIWQISNALSNWLAAVFTQQSKHEVPGTHTSDDRDFLQSKRLRIPFIKTEHAPELEMIEVFGLSILDLMWQLRLIEVVHSRTMLVRKRSRRLARHGRGSLSSMYLQPQQALESLRVLARRL
jgi:hypothetical protein